MGNEDIRQFFSFLLLLKSFRNTVRKPQKLIRVYPMFRTLFPPCPKLAIELFPPHPKGSIKWSSPFNLSWFKGMPFNRFCTTGSRKSLIQDSGRSAMSKDYIQTSYIACVLNCLTKCIGSHKDAEAPRRNWGCLLGFLRCIGTFERERQREKKREGKRTGLENRSRI